MRNNAVYIVLILFLIVTSFFWFQILRVKDLPPDQVVVPPALNAADAEAFIKLAQELLVNYREPMHSLYGRDPFFREQPVEQVKEKKIDPSDKFILSSISYSSSNARAVVNGEILAEGDTIHHEEFGSQFMIENIETDKVVISDGSEEYTLRLALATSRSR